MGQPYRVGQKCQIILSHSIHPPVYKVQGEGVYKVQGSGKFYYYYIEYRNGWFTGSWWTQILNGTKKMQRVPVGRSASWVKVQVGAQELLLVNEIYLSQ